MITQNNKNIGYINIKRWYLEMKKQPMIQDLIYPKGVEIKKFNGGIEEYRLLNKMVGGDLGWIDRQIMAEEELGTIVLNPKVEVHIIYLEGQPAGYTELDFRKEGEVSLEYFGLIPSARGKGLGKFFLQWTIKEAWKNKPRVFKLTTTEKDHPNALPNYLKAGFEMVDERIEKQAVYKNN